MPLSRRLVTLGDSCGVTHALLIFLKPDVPSHVLLVDVRVPDERFRCERYEDEEARRE